LLQAVIYDLDRVIVDSDPLHIESERQILAPYGVELSDQELADYMGRSTRFLFRDIIQKYHLDTTVQGLYPDHMKNLLRLYEEVEPIPGALDLIDDLLKHGIDLALASSSDKDLIASVVKKLHLASTFRVIVSGEEVERTKPYPDIFVETIRRLKHFPHECVVIEDSCAGVQASRNAGIPSVGFRSPHSGNQDLSDATRIIDSLEVIDHEWLMGLVGE